MKKLNGFSIMVVLGVLAAIGIFAMVVPSILSFSNKQLQLQRAEAAALILEMNIRGVLDNPRSYSSINPTFILDTQIENAIRSSTRSVPGMICGGAGVFCKVGVKSLAPTPNGYRVEVQLFGTSSKKMLRTFEQEGPQLSGANIVQCDNPARPVFTGIDPATGNANCRALPVTTCGTNQFVTGIAQDLRSICQPLPNSLFAAAANQFISATSFMRRTPGGPLELDITSTDKLNEIQILEGGEPVVKLKPVEFNPRSGRVNNIDYVSGPLYQSDATSVKCPAEYPQIKITKQEVSESIPGSAQCTTSYTEDKTAASVKCTSPNSANRVKLTLNHECSKATP